MNEVNWYNMSQKSEERSQYITSGWFWSLVVTVIILFFIAVGLNWIFGWYFWTRSSVFVDTIQTNNNVTMQSIIHPKTDPIYVNNSREIGRYSYTTTYLDDSSLPKKVVSDRCTNIIAEVSPDPGGISHPKNTTLRITTCNNGTDQTGFCQDTHGNVGIGTCSPIAKFHVEGSTKVKGDLTVGNSIYLGDPALSFSRFTYIGDGDINNTEILQAGSTDYSVISARSNSYFSVVLSNLTSLPLFLEEGLAFIVGPFGAATAGDLFVFGVFVPSDQRIKQNITLLNQNKTDELITKFEQIKVYEYGYTEEYCKASNCNSSDRVVGVIAQEIQQDYPEMIKKVPQRSGNDTDSLLSIKKEMFIPILIKVLQETRVQNKLLEDRIKILEDKVANLTAI